MNGNGCVCIIREGGGDEGSLWSGGGREGKQPNTPCSEVEEQKRPRRQIWSAAQTQPEALVKYGQLFIWIIFFTMKNDGKLDWLDGWFVHLYDR